MIIRLLGGPLHGQMFVETGGDVIRFPAPNPEYQKRVRLFPRWADNRDDLRVILRSFSGSHGEYVVEVEQIYDRESERWIDAPRRFIRIEYRKTDETIDGMPVYRFVEPTRAPEPAP